jgi:hypothetical protein
LWKEPHAPSTLFEEAKSPLVIPPDTIFSQEKGGQAKNLFYDLYLESVVFSFKCTFNTNLYRKPKKRTEDVI